MVEGPVSAEVVALDHDGMMREAEVLRKIADNIAIKVPLTLDGLKTCKALTGDGTMVNVTLCFSAAQALLAAKAGATFISPFVGRHDDVGFDGMELIADIRLIYDNYDFATQILVASVRHPMHVVEAAKIGADVMTAPPKIIHQLFKHPLTDAGIEGFLADWEKTGQKIVELGRLEGRADREMLQIGTGRRTILRKEQKRQKLLKSLHYCDFREALTMNAILAVAVTAREVDYPARPAGENESRIGQVSAGLAGRALPPELVAGPFRGATITQVVGN